MDSSPCIEQKGVIEEITDGLAKVRITSFTACANCFTKDSCGIYKAVDRHIEIPTRKGEFQKGELILTSIRLKELYAGLISLLILVPYFTGLYFFRDHLRRTFIFTMRKAI